MKQAMIEALKTILGKTTHRYVVVVELLDQPHTKEQGKFLIEMRDEDLKRMKALKSKIKKLEGK